MMYWRIWDSKATRAARDAARWRVEMEEPTSPASIEEFETWLRADPVNFHAYAGIDHISSVAQRLSPKPAAAPHPSFRWLQPAIGLAAVLLVSVIAIGWFAGRGTPAFAAITNASGAVERHPLGHGSSATLDTDTSIEVDALTAPRTVRLVKGRARFAIHVPPDRPMTVETPVGKLVAADCVIDVTIVTTGVQVTSFRGQVDVLPRNEPSVSRTLHPGRSVSISPAGTQIERIRDEDPRWTLARVRFDDAPVSQVLTEVNAVGASQIVVSDPTIARLRLNAVLDLRDSRALARKLAAALDLRTANQRDRIVLSR